MNDFNEYQKAAAETGIYAEKGAFNGLDYVILGLASEAGELAGKLKKAHRDDNRTITEARRADMIKELGDVLWYVSGIATELGTTLSEVAKDNIAKLSSRKVRGTLGGSGDNR